MRTLSVLLVLVTGSLGLQSNCPGLPNASYAELANALVPQLLSTTVSQLSNVTDTMQPADAFVHSYRKQLLALKNHLEVFAAAYPMQSGSPTDPLKTLEGDADDGYEKIGDFQDLAHAKVNYTKKDVDKLRGKILDWKTKFQSHLQGFDYQNYVSHATDGTVTRRKLSKFFWSDHSFQPNAHVDAQANLELLLSQQLESMADFYLNVSSFVSIEGDEVHVLFHDVRKFARAINFMVNTFDCITVPGNTTDTATSLLSELYDKYGDVNDKWTAWNYEVTHNHTSKAEEAKEILDQDWIDLKAWQNGNDVFNRAILQLRTHVRSSAADNWMSFPPACTPDTPVGSHCSISPYELRPTQFEVGLAEVLGSKIKFFADQPLQSVVAYLNKKVIPVIIGNDGSTLYQIDGHHTTYAMHWWKTNVVAKMPPSASRNELLALPLVADIKCNWTAAFTTEDAFWSEMQAKNFVLLEKSGVKMTPADLPQTIDQLTNNPARALAGIAETVAEPCIAKTCVPFAEFRWADFILAHEAAGGMPVWKSLGLVQNYTAFVNYVGSEEFQTLAHSDSTAQLPGHLPAGAPVPPVPDCPWNATDCQVGSS